MTGTNPITGDKLISKQNNKEFEEGWDRIFKSTCKKCGGKMKKGTAIQETFVGIPDFPDGEVCTVSPGGTGKLVSCMKCEECGWSTT